MRTSFPNLPFTPGVATVPKDYPHSAIHANPRTYPRTDLTTLQPWITFEDEIHQAILDAMTRSGQGTKKFTIETLTDTRYVTTEEEVRCHGTVALHEPVQKVLKRLGVIGQFANPGAGNNEIIGDPDFSWVMFPKEVLHGKVMVEYKTWWVAHLQNILADFNLGTRQDMLSKQSFEALEQLYGYMSFNENKFGILSNWQSTIFLRRVETPGRKTLELYQVELNGPGAISMLKAWVGMVLLAEADWFYALPNTSLVPPARSFGVSGNAMKQRSRAVKDAQGYKMGPRNGTYTRLPLDFRLCQFNLSSTRRGNYGCIVEARFLAQPGSPDLEVVCKVVDAIRYPDTADWLQDEANNYAALQNLQGTVIPLVYGYYEVWGILHLLALQPVGNSIPEDGRLSRGDRRKMKLALKHLHDAGFVHGDIARRNFCKTAKGEIFLVDLENCRSSVDPSNFIDEMKEVDAL